MFDSFILAGGRSRRMGKDKAFVRLGGKTMLEHISGTLAEFECGRTFVVTAADSRLKEEDYGFPVIRDVYPDKGALGGIHSALMNCSEEFAFVLACDFPFVSSELIDLLIQAAISERSACAVPIQADGFVQPLCGIWDARRCIEAAERLLDGPEDGRSAMNLLRQVGAREIPFEKYAHLKNADRLLQNLNSPEDVDMALEFFDSK